MIDFKELAEYAEKQIESAEKEINNLTAADFASITLDISRGYGKTNIRAMFYDGKFHYVYSRDADGPREWRVTEAKK